MLVSSVLMIHGVRFVSSINDIFGVTFVSSINNTCCEISFFLYVIFHLDSAV